MPVRPALPVLSAAVSAVLLAGCSAGQETVADDPVVRAPAPSAAAPSASASPTTAPSPAGARVVEAAYRDGEVEVASSRVATTLGEQVVLRITSDVAEEIHVHGYDVYADLRPGKTVDIPLTLTLPGSYEVELHEAGRPLFQLRTS